MASSKRKLIEALTLSRSTLSQQLAKVWAVGISMCEV